MNFRNIQAKDFNNGKLTRLVCSRCSTLYPKSPTNARLALGVKFSAICPTIIRKSEDAFGIVRCQDIGSDHVVAITTALDSS